MVKENWKRGFLRVFIITRCLTLLIEHNGFMTETLLQEDSD